MKKQQTKTNQPATRPITEKKFWMLGRFNHEGRHVYIKSIVKAKSPDEATNIFGQCLFFAEHGALVYCHDLQTLKATSEDLTAHQRDNVCSEYETHAFVVLNRTNDFYSIEYVASPDWDGACSNALKSAAKVQELSDTADLSIELDLTLAELKAIILQMEN